MGAVGATGPPGSGCYNRVSVHPCSPWGPQRPKEVALREYELLLIVDSEADEAALSGVVDRVSGIISGRGGEVKNVDRWGRRRLAFEIDNRTEGQYVVMQLQAEPEAVSELERVLHLADEVLRHKVVRRAA